jgi:chitinase
MLRLQGPPEQGLLTAEDNDPPILCDSTGAPVAVPTALVAPKLGDPPRAGFSVRRVLLTFLLLLAAGAAITIYVRSPSATGAQVTKGAWFAPYVDVTLTPVSPFEDPSTNPSRDVVLGFVVSDPRSSCTPSWGGYYTLAQASETLNLDSRIAQVRSQGGNVLVSFGGEANTELAAACRSATALRAAYQSVITRYHVSTVDFDIEGAALADSAANARRAEVIAALQRRQEKAGRDLTVWLTLPVSTDGLTAQGIAAVNAMLAAHVKLAGVNAMAFDFNASKAIKHNLLGATEGSLRATRVQLQTAYLEHGTNLSTSAVWQRMGVTVMIGQTDVPGEQFGLYDARELTGFVKSVHLARISMWSLNRDAQCPSTYAGVELLSNVCSGVQQTPGAFTRIFANEAGTEQAPAKLVNTTTTAASPTGTAVNPANSPYPIWNPATGYVGGYKVVWDGSIYEAKWFSEQQQPNEATSGSPSPWELIGPVLPSDHAPALLTLPAGTYPEWSPTRAYHGGQRVLYQGHPYEAKWYTQAQTPAATPPDPDQVPWQPLFSIPGEPNQ